MTRSEIIAVLADELCKILPELDAAQVQPGARMADLGADSLDRSEVVQQTMRRLNVRLKPQQLASVANIGDLADCFVHAQKTACER